MKNCTITLGANAMEITPEGSTQVELLQRDHINSVIPNNFLKKPNNADVYYASPSSSFSIGDTVTGADSGATGIIVAFIGTVGLQLSDVVGEFIPGENLLYNTVYTGVGTSAAPGTWLGVSGATTGSGTGISFDVTDTLGTYDSITIANPGIGYQVGDTVTILGTSLGGATPANDLVITIGGDTATSGKVVSQSFDNEWIYHHPTMTVITVVMENNDIFRIELQDVTNQATWNLGTEASLNAAVAAINAWLP